ncbi:MAG: hypothetical protein JNM33_03230 [Rubrivivax sp.]|nr:hypothetical protein [Rubrivivax sp.]
MKHWAPALLLAACAGAAQADETRAQLEQRLRLVARLFADPAGVQRIAVSGQAVAAQHLDEARVHHALAESALAAGDLAAARREVDEALRHLGQARRLAPDAAAQQTVARQRLAQKQAALERLVESWRSRMTEQQAMDGDLQAALGLLETARWFAREGRHVEGLHTAEAAERHVLDGMKRWMQGAELDYTQRAATPAQEFELELQRHAALAELLPLAVAELKPRGAAAQAVERHGESSRGLRAQAQQKAGEGDLPAALALLRQALQSAQRALEAAGVSVPTPSGSSSS